MILMTVEESRLYIKELSPYLRASLVLFSAGFVIGLILWLQFPAIADRFEGSVAGFVRIFRGLSRPQLAAAIFLNNALKTVAAIVLGALLGIVPALFLLANGLALGVVFSASVSARGLGISLLSIVPHGVLELPAVFLGTAIGLMIGGRVARELFRRIPPAAGIHITRGLRFFCTVIAPLLLIASLVEAFLTPGLVERK